MIDAKDQGKGYGRGAMVEVQNDRGALSAMPRPCNSPAFAPALNAAALYVEFRVQPTGG